MSKKKKMTTRRAMMMARLRARAFGEAYKKTAKKMKQMLQIRLERKYQALLFNLQRMRKLHESLEATLRAEEFKYMITWTDSQPSDDEETLTRKRFHRPKVYPTKYTVDALHDMFEATCEEGKKVE